MDEIEKRAMELQAAESSLTDTEYLSRKTS